MPLLIEETTRIAAAPETVWELLCEPQSWRYWWPNAKQAESADRRPLRDGSSFELVVQSKAILVTRRATVEMAQPGRALLWVEQAMGVKRRYAIYLEPGSRGTTVRVRGTFTGLGLPIFRLLGLPVSTAESFRGTLRGLRKAAERS